MTRDDSDLIGGDEQFPAEMTTRQAADFFDVEIRTIQNLLAKGIFQRTPSGQLDIRESVRSYLTFSRKGGNSDLENAKLRVQEETAAKLELANQITRREMLPAGEVEREWESVLRDIRAALMAVSSRLGTRLPGLTPHDITEIDSEIRTTLEELAGA